MITLRRVSEEDADILFKWRNDPDTIKNSLNQTSITWERHKEWLGHSLRFEGREIYIGEYRDHPVGVIRLDHVEGGAEVSVIVAPERRGSGFGRKMVNIVSTFDSKLTLFAVVRVQNAASLIAFIGAGFLIEEYDREAGLVYLEKEPS